MDLPRFLSHWYNWGVAIAFAITFVTALWIFFDSQSNGYQAPLWRWLSMIMAMVVTPSVIISFVPHLALGLPSGLLTFLAVMGAAAALVALLSLLLYGLGAGVSLPESEEVLDEISVSQGEGPSGPKAAGIKPAATPPRGVKPVTTKERITPTPDDTVRIKNVYRQAMPLAWLVALNGPYTGREFRLQKVTDIGREPNHNDVVIEDPTLSRQHARIRYEKGAFVIYDLASVNGVFVNGQRVQRRVLTHGDRIKLGQVMFGMLIVDEDETNNEDEVEAHV